MNKLILARGLAEANTLIEKGYRILSLYRDKYDMLVPMMVDFFVMAKPNVVIDVDKDVMKRFKGHWFYAGKWHEAGCDFIQHDQGGCDCNHSKIVKFLKGKK